MKVLVETSVWSLALRRTGGSTEPARRELENLIEDGRAVIIGPIRQELLSGVKVQTQFEVLSRNLRAFPDLALATQDYEEAARFFNTCRAQGIQGSNTDFLICAAAYRRHMSVLTTDRDFPRYAGLLPVVLHDYDDSVPG